MHPKRFLLSSENNLCFAPTAIREPCYPLLTRRWKESSSTSCICSFMMLLGSETMRTITLAPLTFPFSLCRTDVSDFPQTRSAKLQKSVDKDEDEQPLFLIFEWRSVAISFNRILVLLWKSHLFYRIHFKTWSSLCKSAVYCFQISLLVPEIFKF